MNEVTVHELHRRIERLDNEKASRPVVREVVRNLSGRIKDLEDSRKYVNRMVVGAMLAVIGQGLVLMVSIAMVFWGP